MTSSMCASCAATAVRSDWMEESRKALPQVYDFPKDLPLSFPYVYKNMPLVRQRLLQAGIRIAGVLNRIYE